MILKMNSKKCNINFEKFSFVLYHVLVVDIAIRRKFQNHPEDLLIALIFQHNVFYLPFWHSLLALSYTGHTSIK